MRRYLHIPQIAAVMGQCIAGGAYLPALSDVILMVKGTSFMGLGGPNLVKGATGQVVDSETLGGASTHTEISGVAHYALDNDEACVAKIRDLIERLPTTSRDVALLPHEKSEDDQPARTRGAARASKTKAQTTKSGSREEDLYDLLPADHRMSYDMHAVLRAILDNGEIDEFQEGIAKEMICGDARSTAINLGIIANQRGLIKGREGEKPSIRRHCLHRERGEGRVLHRSLRPPGDSAAVRAGRLRLHGGPRGGARGDHPRGRALRRGDGDRARAEDRAHGESRVGRRATTQWRGRDSILTSSSAGRPVAWRVMEGESAIQAVHGPTLEAAKKRGGALEADVAKSVDEMRADYEHQLDARYAAARGFVDSIVYPENTREVLSLALRASLHNPGPHLGPFVLPPHLGGEQLKKIVRVAARGRASGAMISTRRAARWRAGQIDYLMLDYLAEVTMSILQKQKERDPTLGYARDFVGAMESVCAPCSSAA